MASGSPAYAAAVRATLAVRGSTPAHMLATRMPALTPFAASTQEPRLMGEVTLIIRSMFKKRAGLPRSEVSNTGLVALLASATIQARRASSVLSWSSAKWASAEDAPASPPVKK